MALESVLRSIVKDMGSRRLGEFARFLRDYPDKFPMFSTVLVPDKEPTMSDFRSCEASLRRFSYENVG